MGDSLFSDISLQAAKLALDGLSMRQQAISRNLANVDTPGYQAQTVDFESTIRRALQRAEQIPLRMGNAAPNPFSEGPLSFNTINRSGGSLRADQNNVDIDTELMDMTETGIRYQAISQEISKKLLLLKNIAQSG